MWLKWNHAFYLAYPVIPFDRKWSRFCVLSVPDTMCEDCTSCQLETIHSCSNQAQWLPTHSVKIRNIWIFTLSIIQMILFYLDVVTHAWTLPPCDIPLHSKSWVNVGHPMSSQELKSTTALTAYNNTFRWIWNKKNQWLLMTKFRHLSSEPDLIRRSSRQLGSGTTLVLPTLLQNTKSLWSLSSLAWHSWWRLQTSPLGDHS